MPKCGNCKHDHATVSDIKACYSGESVAVVVKERVPSPWPASEAQIAYIVGLQVERELPDEYDVMPETDIAKLDKDEASRKIQELKRLPYKHPRGESSKAPTVDVPPGRYALRGDDNVWRFFEVQDGKGRWDGYKFTKQLIGAPGAYRKESMQASRRIQIMNAISENVKQAMIDYGLHSGVCGRCSSPLSDPDSLARGIGPVCAGKMGW